MLTGTKYSLSVRVRILRELLKTRRMFLGGVAILSFFTIVALGAPLFAPPMYENPYLCPYSGPPSDIPYYVHPPPTLPSTEHPFGTLLGYDLYYGCVWGTRTAFYMSVATTILSLFAGLSIGSVAGYFEGPVDEVLMRFTDAFFALPGILYVMLIVMALPLQWQFALGPINMTVALSSMDKIIISLAVVGWPAYARLVRGEIKKVKHQDFVEASKAAGCSRLRILVKHVLPNSITPVTSLAFLSVGGVLVAASTISFLGFGPGTGYAEWGAILAGARSYLIFGTTEASWYALLFLIPAVFLSGFVLGWGLLGENLNFILDPVRGRRMITWTSQDSS